MKKILEILLVIVTVSIIALGSCRNANLDPERASAHALQDQVKQLEKINSTLQRIADSLIQHKTIQQ